MTVFEIQCYWHNSSYRGSEPKMCVTLRGNVCINQWTLLFCYQVIIGEDSGVVQVLGISESPGEHIFHFESLSSVCEHDDSVLSVSVFLDGKRAVTAGLDMK
jgi:hypothetical protein